MKWEQTGASLRRSLRTKFQRSREWFGNVCALGLESQRKTLWLSGGTNGLGEQMRSKQGGSRMYRTHGLSQVFLEMCWLWNGKNMILAPWRSVEPALVGCQELGTLSSSGSLGSEFGFVLLDQCPFESTPGSCSSFPPHPQATLPALKPPEESTPEKKVLEPALPIFTEMMCFVLPLSYGPRTKFPTCRS